MKKNRSGGLSLTLVGGFALAAFIFRFFDDIPNSSNGYVGYVSFNLRNQKFKSNTNVKKLVAGVIGLEPTGLI